MRILRSPVFCPYGIDPHWSEEEDAFLMINSPLSENSPFPLLGSRFGSSDVNILGLRKESELYIFLYDNESRAEALRQLGRFADNPELSFNWYDAAVLSQRIRLEAQKVQKQAQEAMRDNRQWPTFD